MWSNLKLLASRTGSYWMPVRNKLSIGTLPLVIQFSFNGIQCCQVPPHFIIHLGMMPYVIQFNVTDIQFSFVPYLGSQEHWTAGQCLASFANNDVVMWNWDNIDSNVGSMSPRLQPVSIQRLQISTSSACSGKGKFEKVCFSAVIVATMFRKFST